MVVSVWWNYVQSNKEGRVRQSKVAVRGGGVAEDAQVDSAVRRGARARASVGNKQAASCLGGTRQQLQLQLQLHIRRRRQRHWAMAMAMAMAMTSGSFVVTPWG